MKRKLYNIMNGVNCIGKDLTAKQVLDRFNHVTIRAWMKYALVGHWHGIAHPISTELFVKRIQ